MIALGIGQGRKDEQAARKFNYNTNLSFSFSVPPKEPKLIDETGNEVHGVVGPYMIGDTVVLKCISLGGKINISVYY